MSKIKKLLKRMGVTCLGIFVFLVVGIAIFEPTPSSNKEKSENTTVESDVLVETTTKEKTTENDVSAETASKGKNTEEILIEEETTKEVETSMTTQETIKKKEDYEIISGVTFSSGSTEGMTLYANLTWKDNENIVVEGFAIDDNDNLVEELCFEKNFVSTGGDIYSTKDNSIVMQIYEGYITIEGYALNGEYDFVGDFSTYIDNSSFIGETTTQPIDYISSSDFRKFIGNSYNIGKTVQFKAEIGMTFDGEYLLYVWCNDNLYEIRSNIQASDPMLFSGDTVLFTGIYNGNTPAGNQLSFRTVSIKLQ